MSDAARATPLAGIRSVKRCHSPTMTSVPSRIAMLREKRNHGLAITGVSASTCVAGSLCTRTVCRASGGPPSASGSCAPPSVAHPSFPELEQGKAQRIALVRRPLQPVGLVRAHIQRVGIIDARHAHLRQRGVVLLHEFQIVLAHRLRTIVVEAAGDTLSPIVAIDGVYREARPTLRLAQRNGDVFIHFDLRQRGHRRRHLDQAVLPCNHRQAAHERQLPALRQRTVLAVARGIHPHLALRQMRTYHHMSAASPHPPCAHCGRTPAR